MEIKTAAQALEAVEAIRGWANTKLPKKQPQPWNGYSPEQCMLLNAQTGLTMATFNLNRDTSLRSQAARRSQVEAEDDLQ